MSEITIESDRSDIATLTIRLGRGAPMGKIGDTVTITRDSLFHDSVNVIGKWIIVDYKDGVTTLKRTPDQ